MNKEIFKLDMEQEEYTTNTLMKNMIQLIPDEENAEDDMIISYFFKYNIIII